LRSRRQQKEEERRREDLEMKVEAVEGRMDRESDGDSGWEVVVGGGQKGRGL